jgi:hypothetical protein
MGRKKRNFDKMSAGFSLGTFERMDAVLHAKEDRKQFVRDAVETELKFREQQQRAVAFPPLKRMT